MLNIRIFTLIVSMTAFGLATNPNYVRASYLPTAGYERANGNFVLVGKGIKGQFGKAASGTTTAPRIQNRSSGPRQTGLARTFGKANSFNPNGKSTGALRQRARLGESQHVNPHLSRASGPFMPGGKAVRLAPQKNTFDAYKTRIDQQIGVGGRGASTPGLGKFKVTRKEFDEGSAINRLKMHFNHHASN